MSPIPGIALSDARAVYCAFVFDRCKAEEPLLEQVPGDAQHFQACFLDEETKEREIRRLHEVTVSGGAA